MNRYIVTLLFRNNTREKLHLDLEDIALLDFRRDYLKRIRICINGLYDSVHFIDFSEVQFIKIVKYHNIKFEELLG